jgi:hypothetical protein
MGANGHADKGFPQDEFKFMLVRFDHPPDREQTIYGYSEVRRTRAVKWPKGMELPPTNPNQMRWRPKDDEAETEVCALFLNNQSLRTRHVNLGYYDVTAQYRLWQAEQKTAETPIPEIKVVSGPIGRKVEVPVTEPPKPGRKAA